MQRIMLLFLVLVLAVWSSPAAGQAAVPGPVRSVLLISPAEGPLRAAALRLPADSVEHDIRPTHWKEGALVGALIGAAGGAVLGAAFCRNSEQAGKDCTKSSVLGGLVVALVLAIPGALIGGQIPKGGPGTFD